jgi:hypothetical protein
MRLWRSQGVTRAQRGHLLSLDSLVSSWPAEFSEWKYFVVPSRASQGNFTLCVAAFCCDPRGQAPDPKTREAVDRDLTMDIREMRNGA